jgi:cobalt-zinc-cadmium efflux system outer membrane protein
MKTIKTYKILNIRYLIFFLILLSTTMHSQSLEDCLSIAAKNNPSIKASYAKFEAALQKSPQVSSLPDPNLTLSVFGRMIETRVGSQEARFSLMQMFPWFGTLAAKENVANLIAEASFQNYISTKNEVFFNIKKVYAEIYEVTQQIMLEEENLAILNSYKELALSKFKNGKGAMVDVMRIDLKRNASETTTQLLKDKKGPLTTQFNSLLNRTTSDEIFASNLTAFEDDFSIKNNDSLLQYNSKLLSLSKKKEAFEAQQLVIKKEGNPMIGLGIDYSIISKRDIPNLEMNGQDAIMPMISVSLPIFRKKYKAMQKEIAFMVDATNFEKQALENELASNFAQASYVVKKSKRLKELYETQLKTTQQAIQLLISAYSNSGSNFEEILSLNQDVLGLKIAIITATKDDFTSQAQLDYLLSKEK